MRTLRERIDSMLYERMALFHKPDETIAQELATMRDAQRMTPALVMRDPYSRAVHRALLRESRPCRASITDASGPAR